MPDTAGPNTAGPDAAAPASEANDAPLAAFDLDGTLIWADWFTLFLRTLAGRARFFTGVAALSPRLTAFGLGAAKRDDIKAAIARRYLSDVALTDAEDAAERACARFLDKVLRADAVAALRAHRDDGARTVIVTAAPEIAAAPVARRLGCALIGTRLSVEDGRLTGALDGPNCRGPEKTLRLAERFGPDFNLSHAYGDSAGDREMLARADAGGYRVFTDGPRAPALAWAALLR